MPQFVGLICFFVHKTELYIKEEHAVICTVRCQLLEREVNIRREEFLSLQNLS